MSGLGVRVWRGGIALAALICVVVASTSSTAGAQDAQTQGDQTQSDPAQQEAVVIVSADASQFPVVDVLVQGPRTVNIEQINLSQDGIEVPTRLLDVSTPDAAIVVIVDPALGPEAGLGALGAFASALDPAIAVGVQAGDLRVAPIWDRGELTAVLDATAETWRAEAPTVSFERTIQRGENLIADQADRFGTVETVIIDSAAFDPVAAAAEIESRHRPSAVVRLVFPDELVDRYGGAALIAALVGADAVTATGFVEAPVPAQPDRPAPTPVQQSGLQPGAHLGEQAPGETPRSVSAPAPDYSTTGRAVGISMIVAAIVVAVGAMSLTSNTRVARNSAMDQVMGGAAIARSAPSDLSAGLVALADRILGRSERAARLGPKLERAGVPMRPTEFLVVVTLVTMAATLVGLSFLGSAFFLAPLMCLVAVSVVLQRMTNRRREKFADQLPGLLASMSGSLRSGNSLLQVLNQASQEVASPARDELQRVLAENRLGRDLAESLRASVERMEVDDYRWVVEAIDVNRSTGGDLTSVLDNVEETIRDRAAIGRQVKALTAEGRISAKMLSVLPFAMYGWQSIMNPEMAGVLLRTPMGRMVGTGALVLMAAGALWMRKIAQLKF